MVQNFVGFVCESNHVFLPGDVVTWACENCVLVSWGASNTTSKEEIKINCVAYTIIKAITNTNCRQRSCGILREMGMVHGSNKGCNSQQWSHSVQQETHRKIQQHSYTIY